MKARFRRSAEPPARHAELLAAGLNLVNEAVTGELVAALRDAGGSSIVLKGPLLRRWIYGEESFPASMDVDLLVPWSELDTVESVLERLGWRYLGIDALGPDRPHCRIWERTDNQLILELHRSIAGIGAPADEAWSVLSRRTEQMPVGSVEADVLDVPARALHIALHAAQHGAGFERTLEDLRRALAKVPESVWRDATDLAVRLQAGPAYATGLSLLPEGEALVRRLGLATGPSTELALRAGSPPPGAEGLEWMTRLPGTKAKAKFIIRHLAPPPAYMRVWLPLARRGLLGLVAAYVWRPVWLTLRSPAAVRAWWRARSETKGTP